MVMLSATVLAEERRVVREAKGLREHSSARNACSPFKGEEVGERERAVERFFRHTNCAQVVPGAQAGKDSGY